MRWGGVPVNSTVTCQDVNNRRLSQDPGSDTSLYSDTHARKTSHIASPVTLQEWKHNTILYRYLLTTLLYNPKVFQV